jgi:hypothetical protein
MGGQKHQFSLPDVGHADLASQVRRQKAVDEPGERADLARFRH